MVEAGDKKAQKPSAEELAQAEHYEAMMAAVARDDEDDYDVEDDEDFSNGAPLDIDNQSLLMARMMQQAQQYQGLDCEGVDGMKDFVQNNEQLLAERSKYMEDQAQLMLQMQAEALAKSGIDPVQAL